MEGYILFLGFVSGNLTGAAIGVLIYKLNKDK